MWKDDEIRGRVLESTRTRDASDAMDGAMAIAAARADNGADR
jgi:hypothetical protein